MNLLTNKDRIEILNKFTGRHGISKATVNGVEGFVVECYVGKGRRMYDTFLSWGGNYINQRKSSPFDSNKWGKAQARFIPYVDAHLARAENKIKHIDALVKAMI